MSIDVWRQKNNKKYTVLLCIAYLVAVVLATLSAPWWHRLSSWGVALFFLFLARSLPRDPTIRIRSVYALLIGAVLLLLATRIIPFVHWGMAPLGYDTGIYLRQFAAFIGTSDARPFAILVQLFSSVGISPYAMVHVLLVLWNLVFALSLYTVARALFRNQLIGVAVLALFALSIAQYEAYIWMFYRMMVALPIFFVTIALLARRSRLAALTGGFAGALHPATFLLFGIAYLLMLIVNCIRHLRGHATSLPYSIGVGVGMLATAFFVNAPELMSYLPYVTQKHLSISQFGPLLQNELTGFYINVTGFRFSTMLYVPLALIGLWWAVRASWKKRDAQRSTALLLLLACLIAILAFVVFRTVFFQRYLILLDSILLLFAGATLARTIDYFGKTKSGMLFLSVFLVGFSLSIVAYSWTRQPWMPPEELAELTRAAPVVRTEDAYGMATDAYYMPWVYGFLTEKTIAPGYLINTWTYEEWQQFWYQGSHRERTALLARYNDAPLYIFVGERQANNVAMHSFLEQYAERVSAHLWRYEQ